MHTQKFRIIVLMALLCSVFVDSIAQKKVKVMVLGMYHMSNPGLDAANMEVDDVTTDKRQKELEELNVLLAKFKPTKIALEYPYGNGKLQKKYEWLRSHGNFQDSLAGNELYQVGFRLAYHLKHDTVYAIDHRLNLNPPSFNAVMQNRPEKAQYLQGYIAQIQDTLDVMSDLLKKKSIAEFLYLFNDPSFNATNHAIYLDFTKEIWDEENYGGADMLADWYTRNLRIFQNLTRITDFDAEEERILVIYGQGHAKILKDLIQDSYYYEDVDSQKYLAPAVN